MVLVRKLRDMTLNALSEVVFTDVLLRRVCM